MKITKTKHQNCITFGFINLSQKNTKRLYHFLTNKFDIVDSTNVNFCFTTNKLYGYFICKDF